MRRAISPRLAMRTLRNTERQGTACGVRVQRNEKPSLWARAFESKWSRVYCITTPPLAFSLAFSSLALRAPMAFCTQTGLRSQIGLARGVVAAVEVGFAAVHQVQILHGVVVIGAKIDGFLQVGRPSVTSCVFSSWMVLQTDLGILALPWPSSCRPALCRAWMAF